MNIIKKPSPNFSSRGGKPVKMIVIHATAGSFPGDLNWMCDPKSKVSTHYYINREGDIYQLVKDADCAWHAGISKWKNYHVGLLQPSVNQTSIGIELENSAQQPYTDLQYVALISLCEELAEKYNIALDDIVGHADVSPGRKTDPYSYFDWNALRKSLGGKFDNDNQIVSDWAKPAWERALKRGIVTKDPKGIVTNEILLTVFNRLGVTDDPTGDLTKERLIVILDRIKKI